MEKYFCTVFTPTYNRGMYLKELYNSLLQQSFEDFEWVIVDDGSKDNTKAIVEQFISEGKLDISYYKKENGGKHRAINYALEYSQGKVFAIVDSDDVLTENALEIIYCHFKEIEKSSLKFAGIAVNKGYHDNSMVGTSFEGKFIDAKSNERIKNNITGDKFEIFYTSVLRQYKFPSFANENFMPEIVVWTRIANDGYFLRFYNDILYLCEYLDDGLTKNQFKILKNNPKGYALRIKEQVKYGNISFKDKMGYYSNYFYLFRNNRSLLNLCKEIDANILVFLLSIVCRKIYFLLGKGNEDEYV